MSMSIDSTEVWDKSEQLIEMTYDDGAECYIVSYTEDGHERNTPVEEVVMMIMREPETGLAWYDCWFMTENHPPVKYVEHLLFVDKETGDELYFDVYEVQKNARGRFVGYELLTETIKYT